MIRTRNGLLIIRAWVEPGSTSPFRAHIRLTVDVAEGFDQSLTVTQEDAVVAVVRAWMSDTMAASPGGWEESD